MANMDKTISVNKSIDTVMARMSVREFARRLGFNLTAQAYVSMAAYNIICRMGMGTVCHGKVTINQVLDETRKGLQVICSTNGDSIGTLTYGSFSDTHWLIDEFSIEALPKGTNIAIIKWGQRVAPVISSEMQVPREEVTERLAG